MAKADPRLALSKEQQRGAAGKAGRKRVVRKVADKRAERSREVVQDSRRDKRTRRSREVARESIPSRPQIPSMVAGPQTTPVPKKKKVKPWPYAIPLAEGKPGRPRLPTPFEYVAPEVWALGERRFSKEYRAGIDKYNQQRERARRETAAEAKAARKERAEEVREARRVLGAKGKLSDFQFRGQSAKDYIENGPRQEGPDPLDIIKGVSKAAFKGTAGLVEDFTEGVSTGLRGRGRMREQTVDEQPLVRTAGDILLGPNVMSAAMGKDYDQKWLVAELGLLWIPVKGAPTAVTTALRALVGGKRIALAAKRGENVAEVAIKALNNPILSQRAARRAALRDAGTDRRASSWVAEKLAGDSDSRLANIIRNDPRTQRTFRVEDGVVQTPARLSRTGKWVDRVVDKNRGRLSRIPGVKSEADMYAQTLARRAEMQTMKYIGLQHAVEKSLPRGLLGRVDWPGVYAVRASLKGTPIQEMIQTTAKNMEEARAAKNVLNERALEHHLNYFQAAAKYLEKDGVTLRGDAPGSLEYLRQAIENSAGAREKILDNLELLADARAKHRILDEQLFYHGAKLLPKDDFVAQTLQAHPIREATYEYFKKARGEEDADFAITVLDASARRHYEDAVEAIKVREALIRESLQDFPDTPMRAQWEQQLDDLASARARLNPGSYYDNVAAVKTELSPEIIAEETAKFGVKDVDWLYALRDHEHPFRFPPEVLEKNRAIREGLEPLTWDNARVLDKDGLPVVGEITFEEMERRLLLASTPEQRALDANWYEEIEEVFGQVFSDKEIMAWLMSQRGQGPAGGVQEVWKLIELQRQGKPLPYTGISKAIKEMREIIQRENPQLTAGSRAKISDFFDSALGRTTRRWMGDGDPEIYGSPMVIDRWSSRAQGIPESPEAVALLVKQHGIDPDTLKVRKIDDVQYEKLAKRYEDFVDYLNAKAFDGRTDWTPREVQAMDWYAIQRRWGREPRTLAEALDVQTYRADFEVTQGPLGLGNDLSPEDATALAESMTRYAKGLAEKTPGLRVRRIDVDSGGWVGGSNVSVHLEVVGTEEAATRLTTALARAFDQEYVQASRWVTVGKGPNKSRRALRILNPALDDPRVKQEFFRRLAMRHPDLGGYMPTQIGRGKPGISIRTDLGNLSGANKQRWADKYRAAVREVENEMGIGSPSKIEAGNLHLVTSSQYGPVHPDDTVWGATGGIRYLKDLDPQAREVRRALQNAINSGRVRFSLRETGGSVDAKIEAVEAQIQALIRQRFDELGGARQSMATGGGRGKSAREWEPGIGRRGAIGGRPGRFIDDQGPTLVPGQRRTARENALREAEQQLIDEGHPEYVRLSDELTALRTEREAGYPEWARFSVREGTGVGEGVSAEAVGIRGEELARDFNGYEEAAAALARQEIPTAFIEAVANSPIHIYDKFAIAGHLNRLSGRTLIGREWADPKVREMMITPVLEGMWDPGTRTIYFKNDSHPVTWIHEYMHVMESEGLFPPEIARDLWKAVGAEPGAKLTHAQSEDVVDMFEAMILGFDEEISKLHPQLKKAMSHLQRLMKEDESRAFRRAHRMLEKLPPEQRLRLEDVFWWQEAVGRKGFFGPRETFQARPGTYVPESPGLPFSFGQALLGPKRFSTLMGRLRSGQRVTTLTVTDKALEEAFTGALLESGRWDRDIRKASLGSLMKAMEIEKMQNLRQGLLPATTALPSRIDDVAIPTNPKEFAGDAKYELGALFRLFDVMDSGKTLRSQELDSITLQGIEQARDYFFPGFSDVTRAQMQDIARPLLDEAATPIDGVRWIPRRMLEKSGIFEAPGSYARAGTAKKIFLSVADTTNDVAKLMTLALNPAYYPMNLSGQGVMLAAQQGAFAPVSLARSIVTMRRLGDDTLAVFDAMVGGGQTSILRSQGGPVRSGVNAVHAVANTIIDKYPRRAAIVYEARRLGYKTDAEIATLLEPKNFDDLFTVMTRANKAMVDFGHLHRFEREWVSRVLFVYPWLRGSTRYAMNFPLDHPIQTAMFAGLLYWQQDRLKEAFPEGVPGYMKWYFPIDTGGDGEKPYGLRIEQLFTPLQPLDLAAEILYWVSDGKVGMPWGQNEEAMISKLNPLYEEILKTVAGFDPFTRQEVARGIPNLMRRLVDPRERWASWDRLVKVWNETTHQGIYDTTQFQNWLRLLLGSLAPINVDPDEAERRTRDQRLINIDDRTPEQRLGDFEETLKEYAPPEQLTPENLKRALDAKRAAMLFDQTESEYKRENDIDTGLSIQERLAVLLLTYAKLHPDKEAQSKERASKALQLSDDEAQALYDEGREKMGLQLIGRLEDRISEARKEERVGAAR